MDPPVFGRGPKGEIWRLEEGIIQLADLAVQLLSPKPAGILVNFYATAIYPVSIERVFQEQVGYLFPNLSVGQLFIEESFSKKPLPTGYFIRS